MALRPKETKVPQNSIGRQINPGIPAEWADVLLAGDSFDSLTRTHGLQFNIYSAASCPNFVANTEEHSPSCENPFCSDGNLYVKKKNTVHVVVSGTQGKKSFEAGGIYDYYAATGLFPAKDDAGETLIVAIGDKIMPVDDSILAVTSESFMINSTSPLTRLKYPIVAVEFITDKDGAFYVQGSDFCLENGRIKWIGPNRPIIDPMTRKGEYLSIRYTYKPYFIVVAAMSSDLRIHAGLNQMTMEKENIRLPQSYALAREFNQPFKGDNIGDSTVGELNSLGAKSILPK